MVKVSQRVNTVMGWGTIKNFEYCDIRKKHCEYGNTYSDGCRIGVILDNPKNWSLSKPGTIPYFLLSDLLDWE